MSLDVRKFYRATTPDRALFADNVPEDQKYYIDFSSVRGGPIIEELKNHITFFCPDEPTCQLFTGHIGCGKSTELLRLKSELEQEGFQVVYLDSFQDLEPSDVDISDILLAIARRVSERLEKLRLDEPRRLRELLEGFIRSFQNLNLEFSVSLPGEIAKITAKARNSPQFRNQLREYLEPRTSNILDAINSELLEPGIKKLRGNGKKGLVVIVDNLEKLDDTSNSSGRRQPEHLFIDRGLQLRRLNCHLVYTIPLRLRFSNELSSLLQRFKSLKMLPMVRVKLRNGSKYPEGVGKLKQMVLARAFPDLDGQQRSEKTGEIFDIPETLERLCCVSGGHVRNLLQLLNSCIEKQRSLPILRNTLEKVIVDYRSELILAIEPHEWDLLCKVAQEKQVNGDDNYQILIRSLFVFEYRDSGGSWFDINPILEEAENFKLKRSNNEL